MRDSLVSEWDSNTSSLCETIEILNFHFVFHSEKEAKQLIVWESDSRVCEQYELTPANMSKIFKIYDDTHTIRVTELNWYFEYFDPSVYNTVSVLFMNNVLHLFYHFIQRSHPIVLRVSAGEEGKLVIFYTLLDKIIILKLAWIS